MVSEEMSLACISEGAPEHATARGCLALGAAVTAMLLLCT